MHGIAVITEACIDVNDRECVDVCPAECIYEYDPEQNVMFAEVSPGAGRVEHTHAANLASASVFGNSLLYVNPDECIGCGVCYQTSVCPVGAIYPEHLVPDGSSMIRYNRDDPHRGHDHRFFVELNRSVFTD